MSIHRVGIIPTRMTAPPSAEDPVRMRAERRAALGCVAIDNNGGALYEPQNPSFLICNPYEDPQERREREERAENGCYMTDAEFATACFFTEQQAMDLFELSWSGDDVDFDDSPAFLSYEEMEKMGLVDDDGMSCTLTEAGLAAVYGGGDMPCESCDDDIALEIVDMPCESCDGPEDFTEADSGPSIELDIDPAGAFNAAASGEMSESGLTPAPDPAPVAQNRPAANAAVYALRA